MHLPAVPSDHRFRILIVEDDPAIVRLAALPLKSANFDVFVARDGLEAWNQLPQVQPHLILADIHMPHLSGHELAQRVRARSAIPILIMTGQDTDEAQVQGFKLGADDYIAKPFTPQLLTTRIAASLRRVYRYNGPIAGAITTKSPQNKPDNATAVSAGLPRGFVRCDSCGYIGPEWKFDTRDNEGHVIERCPHCHNKEITFALG
ncbi:transcriptional regulatory protein WalR [Abditibacteriota bacterium]|nr:transcriptional regulatory protein WalR [Abditibacteriota bacterium]